jgi:hypothetical protein
VQVLVPVITGGVKRPVHAIPSAARRLLKEKPHVTALVDGRRCSA